VKGRKKGGFLCGWEAAFSSVMSLGSCWKCFPEMLRSELPLKSAENRSKVTDTELAEPLGFVLETVFSVRYVLRPRKGLMVQTS